MKQVMKLLDTNGGIGAWEKSFFGKWDGEGFTQTMDVKFKMQKLILLQY